MNTRTPICLRVHNTILQKIDEEAEQNHITRGEHIRQILIQHAIKNNGGLEECQQPEKQS